MAADTGIETYQSPENGDSRIGPLDDDMEKGDNKRSYFSSWDGYFYFKIMILFGLAERWRKSNVITEIFWTTSKNVIVSRLLFRKDRKSISHIL